MKWKNNNIFSTPEVWLWNSQNKQKVRKHSRLRNETYLIIKGVRSWRAHSFPRLHPQRGSDPIQKGADINLSIDFLSKLTCKQNLVTRECMCRTRRRVGEGWSTRAASWTTGACTTSGHKIKTLPRHNGPKAWVLSAKKLILSYVDQNSASESRPHFNFEILAKLQVQNLNPLFSQQCNGAFQHCPS